MGNVRSFRWLITIMIASLTLVLMACGSDSGENDEGSAGKSEGGTSEQVINLVTTEEVPTLKSNGQIDGLSSTVMTNLFEGLYRLDEEHIPTEGIAESHDVNEGGDEYVFHLREDANWADGTPVTADDFVYAWKKAIHPDTVSPHANLMEEIANSKDIQDPDSDIYGEVDELGIEAIDDKTLEVKLDVPIPYFINLTAHPVYLPQKEEFVEDQGEDYAIEAEHVLENGPFVMEEWKHDDYWTLVKNDEYWDSENVEIEEVVTNVVKDSATAINLYEVGDVDVVNLSSDFVDLHEGDEEMKTSLEFEMYFLRFNQKNEYLSNVNIRKALDMGWDKEEAANAILKNGSKPIHHIIPEGFSFSPDEVDFRDKYEGFNMGSIEEAQEYWEKGLEELGVDSIDLELLSYDDEQRSTMAEYIRNQLQSNLDGLTINIHQQPNKVKLDLEDKLDYDISYSGWRGSVQDPTYFLEIWESDGPYNWQDFSNKEYDELVEGAKRDLSDPDKRFEDMQEAERILLEEEAAISTMYQSGTARLVKPYVKGFVAHPNTTNSYKWLSIEK